MSTGDTHPSSVASEKGATEDRTHLLLRLLQGQPAEILGRLASNDPLRLYELGARQTRTRHLLIDADLLFEHLAARIAYAGPQADASALNPSWLIAQADHVIARLMDDEREEERGSPYDCDPEDARYPFLRSIWVEPRFARAASVAFNSLPDRPRKAFFELMLEKRTVEEALATGIWTEEELLRDSWRALGALGLHNAGSHPNPNWQLRP